jgi:hypothetical protein
MSESQVVTERNPRYDGLDVYVPQIDLLQAGDVILTKDEEGGALKGKIISDVICAVTGGGYSHALLCTVPPTHDRGY